MASRNIEAITFIFWIPQAIVYLAELVYWIQVKEYRLDRFVAFLRTKKGRRKLGFYVFALKLLVLYSVESLGVSFTLVILMYFLLSIWTFAKFPFEGLRRPVFTKRAVKIFVASLVLVISGITVFGFGIVGIFVAETLLLLGCGVGVFYTKNIVLKTKEKEVEKAKELLRTVKPIVIGVTGSYGKGTTKDFIYHVLSQKFNTAKTEGSENTEFGIVRNTTKKIKNGVEYFVVEMGAYKVGEISRLAEIVEPSIGVITGIENQHLSLFGSVENIKNAKYELIESLPKGALSVFNLSNKSCLELFQRAKKSENKLLCKGYYLKIGNEPDPTGASFVAEIISMDGSGVEFSVKETKGKVKRKFKAQVSGIHFVENITCAILISRHLGLGWNMIKKGVQSIKTPPKTMSVVNIDPGIIVDDSFNSTPIGFKSALNYLSFFSNNKLVITPGIIELGSDSGKTHREIGKLLSEKVDKVLLTDDEYKNDIKKGMGNKSHIIIREKRRDKIKNMVDEMLQQNYVILVEGRIPSYLKKHLESLYG